MVRVGVRVRARVRLDLPYPPFLISNSHVRVRVVVRWLRQEYIYINIVL
jgi:hypothetical protein